MFQKILCLVLLLATALTLWSESIDTVIWYYKPEMRNGFIFISKKDMTLTLVDSLGQQQLSYPIACGRNLGPKQEKGDNRTPEGHFTLQRIHESSAWGHNFHDGKGFIKHAYGPYFLRLQTGFAGIGIHGTHAPESIGTRATEGCIRLQNDSVAELVQHVTVGMPVIIGPEEGVPALIASRAPSPDRVGSSARAQTAGAKYSDKGTLTVNRKLEVVDGQIDIEPEQDLAEPEPVQAAPVAPAAAITPAAAVTTPVVVSATPAAPEPVVAEPAPVDHTAQQTAVTAEAQAADAAVAAHDAATAAAESTSELKYEVVVEEVTGPDGEVKYEVHYKPIK